MEFVLDNKHSTPLPIIVGTLLIGLTSPVFSYMFFRMSLYHLQETGDNVQVALCLSMAIVWPVAWGIALFLGALNPLFGKTVIHADKEICVRDRNKKLSAGE